MKSPIEWSTVVPAEGQLSRTARELLDLAGHPSLVRTSGNGLTFDVPVAIADVYQELQSPAPPAPKLPQRRGRAPRIPTEE